MKFLWYAKGSAAEVPSQLYHALDLARITQPQFDTTYQLAKHISAMIYNLIKAITTSTQGPTHTRL